MTDEIMMAMKENNLLYVMTAALLIGTVFCRNRRKAFFIPGILISILILNPIMYRMWAKFSEYGYWRLLWILPIIPACAAIPSFVIENANQYVAKIAAVSIALVIFILCGFFVYNYSSTTFNQATNADKLPEDAVLIGQALLRLDKDPYVVPDGRISPYLRQYSGKIRTLYARDAVWEGTQVNSELAGLVYTNLTEEEGDLSFVASSMRDNGYEYLVTGNEERGQKLEKAGFILIQQINEYGIYMVTPSTAE